MSVLAPLAAAVLALGVGSRPLPAAVPAAVQADTGATVAIKVDSAKRVVTIVAGPFDLENMPAMDDHGMKDHGMMHETPLYRFAWPVQGWVRGFNWRLRAADGSVVPREVMHHMIMVNLSRRQLVYNAAERLLGAGSETDDIALPKTIGVPLEPGSNLGFYIAWHNSTGKDLKGVYLEFDMLWTPANQVPRPVNALPIYMDVNLTVGGSNLYDVPPGRSEKAYEFTLPISGRILGIGGHMHDYGSSVRLEDAETGKQLAKVDAKRAPDGKILGVSRKLFGVSGAGLKLKAGHRYRVVGVYDNPTGQMEKNGAMAHMSGIFTPDNLADWPKIDPSDSTYQADLASLSLEGRAAEGAMGHAHMDHGDEHGDHEGMEHDDHEGMDHEHMDHPAADSTSTKAAPVKAPAAKAPAAKAPMKKAPAKR